MSRQRLHLRPMSLEELDPPIGPAKIAPEPQIVEPTTALLTLHDIANAERTGYERGRADAASDAASNVEATLVTIAARLADSNGQAAAVAEASAEDALKLMLATLAASFPTIRARLGEREVIALVNEVLPGLSRQPAVEIHVHPELSAAVAQALSALPVGPGGAARVIPDEAVAAGDATIAWQDGLATRTAADTHAAAWAVIARFGIDVPV